MTVKLPAVAGVIGTSVALPGRISVSIFSGLDMKPWTRSALKSRRITSWPFLSVIWFGEKSYFLAVISIILGGTAALADSCARPRLGVRAPNAIPNAVVSSIALEILLLIMVDFVFMFLLV